MVCPWAGGKRWWVGDSGKNGKPQGFIAPYGAFESGSGVKGFESEVDGFGEIHHAAGSLNVLGG